MYVPGVRWRLSVLVPPWNVGVAPSTLPALDASVRLWGSGEWFVKSIVDLPAFEVRDVVLYDNLPLGLAASCSVAPPDVPVAGVERELAELPQPASATSATRTPAVKTRLMCSRYLVDYAVETLLED